MTNEPIFAGEWYPELLDMIAFDFVLDNGEELCYNEENFGLWFVNSKRVNRLNNIKQGDENP